MIGSDTIAPAIWVMPPARATAEGEGHERSRGLIMRPWQPRPRRDWRVRDRRRLPSPDFATGYLEFARPTIQEGLGALAARGASRILAVPGMLFAASHVKNDLPWEMNSFMAENSGIEVKLGRDLAIDPKLLAA